MHVLLTYLKDITSSPLGHSLPREVSEAAMNLTSLGLQVTILTTGAEEKPSPHHGGNPRQLPAPLLRVIPLARLKKMRQQAVLQCNLSLLAQMVALHQAGECIDVVHCFGWQAGLASGLISQMSGAPLVFTVEDDIAERAPWLMDPQRAYARSVERWLVRRSRLLICPDSYARDKVQDLFLVKDEDVRIVSPVPTSFRRRGAGVICSPQHEARILCLGSSEARGGVFEVLSACSRLVTRRALHLQLLLTASAESPPFLVINKTIRKLRLAQHVSFLNDIDGGETDHELFQHAHLLVIPGRAEFVGNLVFAAMAAGLPIVAANCGALAQFLDDGVNGLKYPYGQARSLADVLEAVLCHPELHRQLVLGARREVRRRPQVGSMLLKIYQQLWTGSGEPCRKGGDIDDLCLTKT